MFHFICIFIKFVNFRIRNEKLEPVEEEEDDQQQSDAPDPRAPKIYHGVPVTDRKSILIHYYYLHLINFNYFIGKFQAHMAVVHSVEEADMVVAELLKDKKIANATHNISCYRIMGANGVKVIDRYI